MAGHPWRSRCVPALPNPNSFPDVQGTKRKGKLGLLVCRNLFQISVKGTWFLFPWHLEFYRNFTWGFSTHVTVTSPPKIPPRHFPLDFPLEPGTRIPPLHGGRVESSPSQALTSPAGIPTSHAWVEKNQGTSGCWEELREFNPTGSPHKLAQLGAERITYPQYFSLAKKQKESIPAPTSTTRLTTLQRTVSAASSKQGNACRFPALHSKCKERVDRWKPRGSFFKPPGDMVTQWRTLLRSWRNINAHPNHDFVLQAGLAT